MSLFLRLASVSVVLSILGLAGCASRAVEARPGQVAQSSAGPLDAASATLIVHGMSCPLCATNVDKQLLEVPGVADASVDMGTGQVKVTFVPGASVTRKQLEDAVYKSGFTLAEVRIP